MKITLLGRSLFLAVAMLATALIFNSCRKELLVQSPDNLKNALSIAEAKSYFNSHLANSKKGAGGLSALSGNPTLQTIFSNKQPVWDKAYQKMISTGGAVKIPLDFGNVMQMVDSKKKSIVPLASLNYLLMYKDNKDVVHAEWVHLRPTKSWIYGKRQVYNGTVEIRDWDGKRLKTYRYGTATKTGKNIKGMSVKSEEEEEESEEVEDCYRIPNGQCPGIGDCADRCDLCLMTCAFEICFITEEPDCDNCEDPPLNPPYTPPGGGETGDTGGGGGSGNGNNGQPDPSDYPPNCNPDPGYVVPDYPAPVGTEWILPCGDVPIPEVPDGNDPYEGIDLSSAVRTLSLQLGLAPGLAEWLEVQYQTQENTLVADLNSYLAANNNSQESRDFGNWVVEFIIENTDVDFADLVEMNSIPNSTITLPNIIDVTNLNDYPAFKSMVENLPAFLNQHPEVLKSLSRYTGFSKTKIMQLMQPGKGPKVELVSNLTYNGQPAFGQYTPGTYILKINKELVIGLDKVQSPNRYRALGMLLSIVTLHEFVHYGRDVNKMTSKINLNGWDYDTGFLFELSISPPYLYDGITRNNAIQWANFYKFNIND